MRITGGEYKGRTVKCPPGIIRPAMDRMRESMFSILGSLEGLSFLDIFSGSGVVGIEAASRGADPVELVEKDGGKRRVILQNLTIVNHPVKLNIMAAQRYLKGCRTQWDTIHLDPPFPFRDKLQILELVESSGALKVGGTLMMHYPGEEKYPENLGTLRQYDKRTYGRSHLIFYTRD